MFALLLVQQTEHQVTLKVQNTLLDYFLPLKVKLQGIIPVAKTNQLVGPLRVIEVWMIRKKNVQYVDVTVGWCQHEMADK